MPLDRADHPRDAIGSAPSHRLEPFGLWPQPKTTVRNGAVAPYAVRHQTAGRVDAIPLGELKKGTGRQLQVRIRGQARRRSNRFVPVKQPYPFVVMARLGQETPVLANRR